MRRSPRMIQGAVERCTPSSEENRFLEVTYANGDKEVLYFKDFNSGAMIQNIVDRAKKMAIKDHLETGDAGLRIGHLMAACVDEFKENEDLPEHDQPGRLGADLGKEGRAHRLHPHPHQRQGRRLRPGDRHGDQHRPVPLGEATCVVPTLRGLRAGALDESPSGNRRPFGRAGPFVRPGRLGGATGAAGTGRSLGLDHERAAGHGHRGGVRHLGARRADRESDDAVRQIVNAWAVADAPSPARPRWDFEEESPLRDARGFDLSPARRWTTTTSTRTPGWPTSS